MRCEFLRSNSQFLLLLSFRVQNLLTDCACHIRSLVEKANAYVFSKYVRYRTARSREPCSMKSIFISWKVHECTHMSVDTYLATSSSNRHRLDSVVNVELKLCRAT